ncbi:MAG: polyphenol oxidase family protein [Acidobacteriota bacterium]
MWPIEDSSLGRILVAPDVPPGFAVLSTTRDYPGKIVAHELTGLLRERFGLETSLTTCRQVHGASVAQGRGDDAWRECDSCDALWSVERHTSLGIKVADCLPVALIDPAHQAIANVHSGWRGALQRVTAATLEAAPLDPATTHAWLGPSIRACCFEVGEEVATQFEERFLDRSRAKAHVDLVAYTVDLLLSRGIAEERIHDSGACTRCDDSIFHSYRREGPGGGRNLVLVAQ